MCSSCTECVVCGYQRRFYFIYLSIFTEITTFYLQFICLYWWIWILIILLKFTRCYHFLIHDTNSFIIQIITLKILPQYTKWTLALCHILPSLCEFSIKCLQIYYRPCRPVAYQILVCVAHCLNVTCWAYGHCVTVIKRTFCHGHLTQRSQCQIHVTFLCVSFATKLLVMFLGKTGKGFLAWNRQAFSNIIYVIQKHTDAINDTTDSWDVIWNVQCYALFTDFSKIKQLQPPLIHVAKPKGMLQSASTASHVSKYRTIAILRCFGNYACVVNMSIHTIYMLPQQKQEQKCFRGFKVCSDYEHTAKGRNSLPSDVLMRISKKIIEDSKHQET